VEVGSIVDLDCEIKFSNVLGNVFTTVTGPLATGNVYYGYLDGSTKRFLPYSVAVLV
jgi:hypothetical protein